MKQEARLDELLEFLIDENDAAKELAAKRSLETIDDKIALFQGLCNIRPAERVSERFLDVQNAFLTEWNSERGNIKITDLVALEPQLYLWQGDITTLEVDAIVNAANSRLLGCMLANHTCIDNIIHTRAGVQLRLDCADIIARQGRQEPVGKAKITPGYNLPAKYVIHTVGPFIDERGVSSLKEQLLASSYKASLALADEYNLNSVAFCCISTGEFNFPNVRAAEIAIATVKEYLQTTNSNIDVIFNVFKNVDLEIYQSLIGE